jgi:hypothetical protein
MGKPIQLEERQVAPEEECIEARNGKSSEKFLNKGAAGE